MKLKSIIILSIIALGTLPLLIFVSINLKEHINRHEESTLQSLKTRAAITLSALQQKSSYLEQELQRIASLENIQNLVTTVDSPAQFANNQHSALQIINLWFLNSSSIDNFHFFDAKGRSLAFFNRQQNTSFAPFIISENSTFTQKPLQDKFSALIITAEENI